MRAFSLFSSLLAAVSSAVVAHAQAPQAAQPPTFETLFVGSLSLGQFYSIPNGTFGTRIHAIVTGGTFTDPEGNEVATLLPTADTGIVSNSGIFFPRAVLPLIWTADNRLAHIELQGVGALFASNLLYLSLETDSEQYSSLNSRTLLGNITFTMDEQGNPNSTTVTVFGAL